MVEKIRETVALLIATLPLTDHFGYIDGNHFGCSSSQDIGECGRRCRSGALLLIIATSTGRVVGSCSEPVDQFGRVVVICVDWLRSGGE